MRAVQRCLYGLYRSPRTYTLEQTGGTAVCNCGQCQCLSGIQHYGKYEYRDVREAVRDPEKIVIFNTSPSVRIALGEEFDMEDGSFVQGKMVALLRKPGASHVLDTNFAADLTIMEEASELIERITKRTGRCRSLRAAVLPGSRVREIYHPDRLPHLSTAKSPIGMQGPTVKTYFSKKMGLNPEKIVNVAVTPLYCEEV